MEYEQIRAEVDDGVLTITLHRPDRLNAWTPTMGDELIAAFDAADADDAVQAIVVTGAGRGFCAGADLAGGGSTFDWRERDATGPVPRDGGGRFTLRVFDSCKPVIAAINGPAVGVGATMTLPMDVRLAADDARMGFVFARRGIVPGGMLELVPPPRRRDQPGDGVGRHRPRVLRPGGTRGRPSAEPASRRRAARRRALAGPGDRRQHGAGVGRARAADDVADARRPAPDARPPGRLAGDVLPRPVRRRTRGRDLVPGEARGPLPRPGQRRAAGHHARLGDPRRSSSWLRPTSTRADGGAGLPPSSRRGRPDRRRAARTGSGSPRRPPAPARRPPRRISAGTLPTDS